MMEGFTTGRLLALIRRFTGNLADLQTTAKTNLVAAINEVAASGGGSEEDYSIVYQETLPNSHYGNKEITSSDMGGAYNDIVVFFKIANPSSAKIGVTFMEGNSAFASVGVSNPLSNSEAMGYGFAGCRNDGGLITFWGQGNGGMDRDSLIFPASGITKVIVSLISSYSRITVYARRKVTA